MVSDDLPDLTHLSVDRRFLDVLDERVVVADGAMGTMLQDAGERGDLVLDDFVGLEGCNEILNDTRPDVVADIHRAYFAAGALERMNLLKPSSPTEYLYRALLCGALKA